MSGDSPEPAMATPPPALTAEQRNLPSHGSSGGAIGRLVERVLARRHPGGGTLVDVGCGTGSL